MWVSGALVWTEKHCLAVVCVEANSLTDVAFS